uniref:Retrotransposon protein, putative, unclassified n=2 Tax=Oryza sativa subsp. japonica TaxID=39947 RepID=Q53J96_ORYSJ|nr:hypothetical protein [Oryza sativa Japonica Group]AAX95812.1 retrotransposon protein, putative, unclassified [Oryza sativa Japonica Group]ABA93059.1 retrotransposon protein, putative, unclassified [Oryza sativa Japonica Group]
MEQPTIQKLSAPQADLYILSFRHNEKKSLGAAWARFSLLTQFGPDLSFPNHVWLQHFRGSFAHKTTAEGRELLDLILENDSFGRSEAVPEVKIIREELLHVDSEPDSSAKSPSQLQELEEEEIHPTENPFQFEEDLLEDYGNTLNYSCEKRPPTKVNSNDPLDKAMLKETVKKLTTIMSNEWPSYRETLGCARNRCPQPENRKNRHLRPYVAINQFFDGALPVPEPIEEVMAISPFEPPESNLDEFIEEFNEGEDESGETIDLPKTDQPSRAPIELKPLPSVLRYAFLNGDSESLVIISDKLSEREMTRLIAVLEKHHAIFGCSLQDLKGISPTLCTHRIPLNPSCTPSREPQRRLNNRMREVVKKEVLKLLHAGIIYPVPYNEWVSPVQVVPKKGGMTVIENSNNELIPQRTFTRWRMRIDYRKLNKAIKKDHFPLPFIGWRTIPSFVSLMGIMVITKSPSIPMIKVRPRSHAHTEHMHIEECNSPTFITRSSISIIAARMWLQLISVEAALGNVSYRQPEALLRLLPSARGLSLTRPYVQVAAM